MQSVRLGPSIPSPNRLKLFFHFTVSPGANEKNKNGRGLALHKMGEDDCFWDAFWRPLNKKWHLSLQGVFLRLTKRAFSSVYNKPNGITKWNFRARGREMGIFPRRTRSFFLFFVV